MRCGFIRLIGGIAGYSMCKNENKDYFLKRGFVEAIDGNLISRSSISKIVPIKKDGVAAMKNKSGRTLGYLRWP